jgi:orotate phosphoribosyltransferase
MKLMQEELKYQKNKKALKRMNKVVVGGRKAPMIFNLKNFNTQNKTRNSEKSDEKLNIYDITGDKDENEEK